MTTCPIRPEKLVSFVYGFTIEDKLVSRTSSHVRHNIETILRIMITYPTPETLKLHTGGTYRYVWRSNDGAEMGMGGVYREIVASERIVNTESFDEPWYPGGALDTTVLIEQGSKTTLTLSTSLRRPATLSSKPTWSKACPRSTTGLPGCWPRRVLKNPEY
jgi:hypothetical protein